jgi:protoporphyrinogen oxidase
MKPDVCEIAVLGGGIAGLSAAYRLEQEGADYCLFEAEKRVGGLCRSERVNGFTFDYTGHLLHFTSPEIENLVREVSGGKLVRHERKAWIFSNGSYTAYPFQRNLYGLPDDVIRECILDYVEADLNRENTVKEDFASWAVSTFGRGISEHFMIPYNRKMWTVEPDTLTCDWMGRFVPGTNAVEVIEGAFSPSSEEIGYNAHFFYPQQGGIEIVPNSFASRLSRVKCSKKAVRTDLTKRLVHFDDGSSARFENLISTIPLPDLMTGMSPAPDPVREAAAKLAHTSLLDVNLGFKAGALTDKHWVYVPDPGIPFYRIGFPHNFSDTLVPRGKCSAYAEIPYRHSHTFDEDSLVKSVISGMRRMGLCVSGSDVDAVKIMDIKYAYVIYDFRRRGCLDTIKGYLGANGVNTAGRFGSWSYLSMEDSIREGLEAAEGFIH